MVLIALLNLLIFVLRSGLSFLWIISDIVIWQLGRFFKMSLVRDTIFARASFTELLEISFVPTTRMILSGFFLSSGWM